MVQPAQTKATHGRAVAGLGVDDAAHQRDLQCVSLRVLGHVRFNPLSRKEYALVNLRDLELFEVGSVVDLEALGKAGLIGQVKDGVKVLGDGELTKSLTVKAHKFSKSAEAKIAAAGGTLEVL